MDILWERGSATVGEVVMALYLAQHIRNSIIEPVQRITGLGEVLRGAGRMLNSELVATSSARATTTTPNEKGRT